MAFNPCTPVRPLPTRPSPTLPAARARRICHPPAPTRQNTRPWHVDDPSGSCAHWDGSDGMRCALVALDDARVGFKLECALWRSSVRSSGVQDLETKAPSEQGEHRVMTLTRECEEANLTSPGSMPAGFLAHPPAGDASDVPACTISRKVREGGDPRCGGLLRWEAWCTHFACWCSFR